MDITYGPRHLEPEHRFTYPDLMPGTDIVHISGTIHCNPGEIKGDPDDKKTEKYSIRVLVGPWFDSINKIVPLITVAGFNNMNSDSDNQQQWFLQTIVASAVRVETNAGTDAERIELFFEVIVQGENSVVSHFGYTITCTGKLAALLTRNNIFNVNTPGPVARQNSVAGLSFTDADTGKLPDCFAHKMVINRDGKELVVLGGKRSIKKNLSTADDVFTTNRIEFLAGPSWTEVEDITVSINLTHFTNTDADEDESLGWHFIRPEWERVYGFGPSKTECRIKVSFDMRLTGVKSRAESFSYLIFAQGRVGEAGLDKKELKNAMHFPEKDRYDMLKENPNLGLQYWWGDYGRVALNILDEPGHCHVVFSGSVAISNIKWDYNTFDHDDSTDRTATLYIPAGPFWRKLVSAVPRLFLAAHENKDADETDIIEYKLVGESPGVVINTGFQNDEKQFYLQCTISHKGEATKPLMLSYMVSAVGVLGEKGVNNP